MNWTLRRPCGRCERRGELRAVIGFGIDACGWCLAESIGWAVVLLAAIFLITWAIS